MGFTRRIRGAQTLTYDRAITQLNGKDTKKLANVTYLERRSDGDIAVKFYHTDIVIFHPDYSITVRTGGWDTVATRSRLTDLTDFQIYREKNTTYIEDVEGTPYYMDSVTEFNSKGEILNQVPVLADRLGKFLGKNFQTINQVRQEIRGMTLDSLETVWKKFQKERGLIARNCKEEFLPLALASSKNGDEYWMEIIRERLSSTEVAA